MDNGKALVILTIIITAFAMIAGFVSNESDLVFIGVMTTLMMVIVQFMSAKRGRLRWELILPLTILMIPCIIVNTFLENDWPVHIIGTVPVYEAAAIIIIAMQIAYCGVRLDRIMLTVYIFFTSMAMGGFIGAGYYIFNVGRGVSEEMQQIANYWIGWEYLAVTVASIVVSSCLIWYMKKHGIKLITSEMALEAER